MTVAELRALLAKATPGPRDRDICKCGDVRGVFRSTPRDWHNAELIVAMHGALPALLDVAEAANECMAGWEGAACVVTPPCGGCDACTLSIALARLEAVMGPNVHAPEEK